MNRLVIAAIGLIVFGTMTAQAADNSGTFVRYDSAKKMLTVKVQEKETEFALNESVKITTTAGTTANCGIDLFADENRARPGAPLTVVTETKNGKEVVVEIKLGKAKK